MNKAQTKPRVIDRDPKTLTRTLSIAINDEIYQDMIDYCNTHLMTLGKMTRLGIEKVLAEGK